MPIKNRRRCCNKRGCTKTGIVLVTIKRVGGVLPVEYKYCQEHIDLGRKIITRFKIDNRRRGTPKHWNITHERLA